MKVAIMQPYFLPYIGYISLLKHTDKFILLDNVQYIRHGWINRNRILKPENGWQYIQVPLSIFSRETLIKDVNINNSINWKEKIIAQLQHYKKKAPYYKNTIDLLNTIFELNSDSIVDLNKKALEVIVEYLEIDKHFEVFSQIDLQIETVNATDEWALNICKAIGNVNEYWNPPGGQLFFDKKKFSKENIELKFHSIKFTKYDKKQLLFEPGLSIIDTIMFNSIDKINIMLDNYEII